MSRITAAFEALKREGKKGFIPFITAGDPDLKATEELLVALSASGASIIELGVPFSDPMADGPVIQRASERALRHHFKLSDVFETAARASRRMSAPVVLFSYFNPLLQYGLGNVCRSAAASGIDGILVTDLTPEESGPFAELAKSFGLDLIFLVAPTSSDDRLQMIAERASGFIYAVSRAGVTGTQESVSAEAEKLVTRVKRFSTLPVAVGFGISNTEQVKETARYADAVVVGSAIVAEIERSGSSHEAITRARDFSRRLMLGLT
jgi:tryptophan synthase alpha chain